MSDMPSLNDDLIINAVRKAYGDAPAVGQVAQVLAESEFVDVDQMDAFDIVEDALDRGILREVNDGSLGGVVAAQQDDTEPEENKQRETDEPKTPAAPAVDDWADLDFSETESATWPPAWKQFCRFMTRKGDDKQPFAGWGDKNAPVDCAKHDQPTTCDDCFHDARYKWGYEGNYGEFETARKYARMDPRLASDLVFIQRENDPFAFVDGDDVIDPETGDPHPEFVRILTELGVSYADISQSGSGSHVMYRGSLPDGVKQAVFEIDNEPWGANDEGDRPTIEIYDGKHVCVATGDHIVGSGLQIRQWNDDALNAVLDEYGQLREQTPSDAYEEFDATEYEPSATEATETTDDIRDIYHALDRLDARRVADATIVEEWLEPMTSETPAFVPTWAPAGYDGTANFVNERSWTDSGTRGGYGPPACMAAIDAGLVTDRECPGAVSGETWFNAVDHLRDLGFNIPELDDNQQTDYETDPRALSATVDTKRAWEAASRVTRNDLEEDHFEPVLSDADAFGCPCCGEAVDVVRAVAIDSGLVDSCAVSLDEDYPEAYNMAREDYGAPLPRYYTIADAVAEFDAVLDLKDEVGFFDFDTVALRSEVTKEDDELSGEAVRALDPAWRESETGESVLVFENGTLWDADSERVLDSLRFVALDSGLIDDPSDPVAGDAFTTAWRLARVVYGAPLPRWEPAQNGARELTPMLPPAGELREERSFNGVDADALNQAREDVEALIRELTSDGDMPNIVRALPATGKTTGTVKIARDRALSYLAPRKELQQQALDKADRWDVDARILPVFSEQRVRDEVLSQAVSHVREQGKDRLRDRWAILTAVDDQNEDDDSDGVQIFNDNDDEDGVELNRPTCPTAEGKHGKAWALTVHVARRLGYTPREIHAQAEGLFGTTLPCEGNHDDKTSCDYGLGWEHAADPDDPADLLVGSYVHAHVKSVRTRRQRVPDGTIEQSPRAVVLDEFPGEAFARDFDEKAFDFATWLACSLRADVADRRDMVDTDLWGDSWVRDWLDGNGTEHDAVDGAVTTLTEFAALREAQHQAGEILDTVDEDELEDLGLADPLEAVYVGDESADACHALADAIGALQADRATSGLVPWVSDAVLDPLTSATNSGTTTPSIEGVEVNQLPVGGDLAALVEDAAEAAREDADRAPAVVDAAVTALTGGRQGCRRLAAWADDGYAHPDAHHLLRGVITPTDADSADPGARRISTSEWAFDPDATDGTMLDIVDTGTRSRIVMDRNDHGATLLTPPDRTAGNGDDAPLVGLDATAREKLWATALGEEVSTTDIHDTDAERAAFLEDALDLRVIQAADDPRYYEGDPKTKDTDGDVSLLEALTEQYSGIEAPRERGAVPTQIGKPAAITTKGVRNLLEQDPRLDDVVSAWENYGNVTGANDLGGHRLAAILGCQHYGDAAVERFAALAGESVTTDRGGRGAALDYENDLANAYLKHMTEDQTMQAVLRFARGEDGGGATVVARTSALREDLPVVGRGQVVGTWSTTATQIARQWRRLDGEFTAADMAAAVDVTTRQVRRVLAELVEAGYLTQVSGEPGKAKVYDPQSEPGAGEVNLPDRPQAAGHGGDGGPDSSNQSYTWSVRVYGGNREVITESKVATPRPTGAPPAPPGLTGG